MLALLTSRRVPGALVPLGTAVLLCSVTSALLVAQTTAPRPVSRPPSSASRPVRPDPAVIRLREELLADTVAPGVTRGVWGIVVHSLDRDERLFELNAQTLLIPASTAKIISAVSAVDAVGWDYTYATTVRAAGPIVDGVLTGDLIVIGSGDPTPGGRAGVGLQVWVDALKAAGLRKIEGRVIGDDDGVQEPRPARAWSWEDLGYVSGALFGALNATENRMNVTISPGPGEGAPATLAVEGSAQERPLVNRTVTTASQAAFLWSEQRPGEPALTIAGSVRPNDAPSSMSVSVGNPTLWFATLLRDRLIRGGVEVTGRAADIDDVQPPPDRAAGRVIYVHRSRPLSEIVKPMLKESINLYGEAVMRLNAPPGVLPTNDAALEGLRKRFAAWGIADDAQQIVDGSGLSRHDLIAPQALARVLQRMHDPTGTSPFVAALPIAGVDGSLANRLKGTSAEGNLRAKTGTMSNVRSLAGYLTTRDGEHLAVVVMANNYEGSGAEATQAIDRIAVRLADFTRR
jgi:D-alanyl-D-alanine carboxypeptidase/D-alanyl-D-alanine-endopeptidase (penicillin-binding protein 4)